MQCSQYLQDVHPSKEKERELQREKAVLVLCHLSSRGAAVSAYNDDVPASFLRDVAAYIARRQSVKTLKRRKPLLGEFSWLGHIALQISQRSCRSGLWQPLCINHECFKPIKNLSFHPHTSWPLRNEVQVLPESHPAPFEHAAPSQMRMHHSGISRERFAEQKSAVGQAPKETKRHAWPERLVPPQVCNKPFEPLEKSL